MQIIDSNIIIYSSQPKYAYLKDLIKANDSYASKVTKVEVLGYHDLGEESKKYFKGVFELLNLIDIDDSIIDKAINLR